MGAKYLPTIKDQKYNQRYHSKTNPMPVFRKDARAAVVNSTALVPVPAAVAAKKKAKS